MRFSKIILFVLLFIIGTAFVCSQKDFLVDDYKRACIIKTQYINVSVPQYESKMVFHANGTDENVTTSLGFKNETITKLIEECEETVGINGHHVDFKLKGYNCKENLGEVICDNDVNNGGKDGNGDGICQSGETCCKIKDNIRICGNGFSSYKNGSIDWTSKGGIMPVGPLGVQ